MNPFDTFIHSLASGSPLLEDTLRLLWAAAMGAIVGLEREFRGHRAGFRTNLLVGLASALVITVARHVILMDWSGGQAIQVRGDLTTAIYAVMLGISFLGSGIIGHGKREPSGLTTGAALWTVAALGITISFGLYSLTLVAFAIVLTALFALRIIDVQFIKRQERTLVVSCPWSVSAITDISELVKHSGIELKSASFRRTGDLAAVHVRLRLNVRKAAQLESLQHAIQKLPAHHIIALS